MAVPILKEPPITSRDAVIPYLMTALNMLAPVFAAYSILSPHVLITAITLILLGVPCSVYFRQRGYNRIVLNLITTFPLLILTWALVHTHPGLQIDWSNPLPSMLAHESLEQLDGMLHVFTVLAAGRAFLLITSADLLQTPLPGISTFLLAVIAHHKLDSNPLTLVCLLLLFITSAYLFSHEHHQQWFAIHTPPRIQRQLLTWTVIFAIVLFPIVLVLGINLQGFNMTMVTSRMAHRPIEGIRNPFGFGGGTVISLGDTVEMGSLDWPRGKQPIMSVIIPRNASQTLLWRGATYDQYEENAGRWTSTTDDQWQQVHSPDYSDMSEGWGVTASRNGLAVQIDPNGPLSDPGIVEAIKERKLKPEKNIVVQIIKTKAPMMGKAVPFYGAAQIIRVDAAPSLLQQTRVTSDGAVLGKLSERGESTYIVTSLVKPLPTAIRLNVKPILPKTEEEKYLQMPGGPNSPFSRRIREKALEILKQRNIDPQTAQDFDTVHQLELELNQNYRYTLKPSRPPQGVDPIVDFLEKQKRGYCNYFSGSMVMLCRSVGIPARLVVGFATGDMDDKYDDPETVKFDVDASMAHSWVEVYLKQYGWYIMDPTAGSRMETTFAGMLWDSTLEVYNDVKAWIGKWVAAFRTSWRVRMAVIGVLVLLISGITALVLILRDRPPRLPRRELPPAEARKTILTCYKLMHRWMEHWGVHKPEGCTATEFKQLFHQLNPAMGDPVCALTDLYIGMEYGGKQVVDADARQAISYMCMLWALSKTERKNLYDRAGAES